MWEGYPLIEYTRRRGPIFMHRIIIEKKLGRSLMSHEMVHHKDGNRMNYSEANLELTTHREHIKIHGGFGNAFVPKGKRKWNKRIFFRSNINEEMITNFEKLYE